MQKPKLQMPLAQVPFDVQGVPLGQPPQSLRQLSPLLLAPHSSSGGEQVPSPQNGVHRPASQLPLQQAAPVVQGTFAP
jgi:hypothetical protein